MTVMKTIQNVTGPTLTIDLPPEFQDRQVEVEVRILDRKERWGDGMRRCAGIMSDDPEFDSVMDEIHRERKRERRTSEEE